MVKNLPKDMLVDTKVDKEEEPEWKREMRSKEVGFRTKLSIKEQQKNLPIYKLKKEFT